MEIMNKRVLVLGGAGLVGMAICRKVLKENPDELIVASLSEAESVEACGVLRDELQPDTIITPAWGDIFLPESLQGMSRRELMESADARQRLIDDILGELSEEVLGRSHLYQLIRRFRPHLVVDCINSATAVAYQDIFSSYFHLKSDLASIRETGKMPGNFLGDVEKMLCTLYVPQLIRHVQILYEAMRRVRTEFYFKIGTSGTGGMGLNIPYTHSEEKPSRVLLSKSSIAGAHTMLLFLMARTPDAPITKEIKPTAAIAWKKIAYGPVRKGGKPIELYDCPPENAVALEGKLPLHAEDVAQKLEGEVFKSVYIDTGENGIFSQAEFAAISSTGQMEVITPEEIARNVVYEIKGGNTGHDIINALDNATMGPTYRAGLLRQRALKIMQDLVEKHQCDSVAFELLGPPRLSKLLYEAHLLKLGFKTMEAVRDAEPEELVRVLEKTITGNKKLRSEIISIGLPILMPDGKRILRGPVIKIPPFRGTDEMEITEEAVERWAYDGWVDLRKENMQIWKKRMLEIFEELNAIPENDTSSQFDRERTYWLDEGEINVGKVVGWILDHEEKGARMKA
ncbi:MAG TPA: short-chain dehydrogenase [Bacteroidetes bacterium]|nr:short-chain dehydrogenase [Bacteroidota bacterium]